MANIVISRRPSTHTLVAVPSIPDGSDGTTTVILGAGDSYDNSVTVTSPMSDALIAALTSLYNASFIYIVIDGTPVSTVNDIALYAEGGAGSDGWLTYDLTIGGTTTAPTKGTIVHDIARYRVDGKVLHLNYAFEQSTAGTSGVGAYTFSLPPGITIDTSLAPLATVLPLDQEPSGAFLGAAYGNQGVVDGRGYVTPYSTTELAMNLNSGGSAFFIKTLWFDLGAGTTTRFGFEAQIPIL